MHLLIIISKNKLFVKYFCSLSKYMIIGLSFDLDLPTRVSIGIIYSSRTSYLPSLKLLKLSVLDLSVAHGEGEKYDL